jgi:diaminopimelate epimerase
MIKSGVRTVPFVKATACGNDFLLIDLAAAPEGFDLDTFTQAICDRHLGIGADGVEWMLPHSSADVEIRLINADGSDAEISGNGTRCVAAFLCSEQGKEKITVQTGAGLKTCVLTSHNDWEYEFEIAMGAATVEKELTVKTRVGEVRGIPVSLGNPHYVVFVSDVPPDWQSQAAEIQRSPQFKHGVNVEFVAADGKHEMRARFFERGVGETQSSGTGSCASAAAAMATGRADSPVKVHAPGGTQTVRQEGNSILLRGPAHLLCRGEFFVG